MGPGNLGFSSADDDAHEAPICSDINITPLTDVMLVLLIIFMVSSSAMVDAAREGRLDVSLPQAGHASSTLEGDEPLVIGVALDGRLFVKGGDMQADGLEELLRRTHQEHPNTVVIVDADGALPHKKVVDVIDLVRAAGFEAVAIGAQSDP